MLSNYIITIAINFLVSFTSYFVHSKISFQHLLLILSLLVPSVAGSEINIATINIGKNTVEVILSNLALFKLTSNNGNFISKEMGNKMINSSVATSNGGLNKYIRSH